MTDRKQMITQQKNFGRIALPTGLAVLAIYLINLSLNQFDQTRQVFFSWGMLFILLLFFKIQFIKKPHWRILFLLLCGVITYRYLAWRTTESLIYTGAWDFVGMALLFLAELYAITIHCLGMIVNLWPMRNRPALEQDLERELPTVDVFIPTYDEQDDIIRITATAATQLNYPKEKLKIYICDDGGTVNKRNQADPVAAEAAWKRHFRLRKLARELDIGYLTRETNRSAKAGNINHALTKTQGDLILMLDCDHVPTHDLLQRTVDYFIADPKLFLVQTPHFFINPTPIEKNLTGVGDSNEENEMFYREIQRSLDFWNSSYFCGSAALLRREFLLQVGGISGVTVTEDAETSLKLHSMGYNSTYIDRPMVCGLSPESYDEFIIQRTRWAHGMTQLLMLNNPLLNKGLRLQQRICYLNSCIFWFFGLSRFIFYIAPAFFLLLGLQIYHASLMQIVIYSLPFVLSNFLLMDFLYGRTRKPFFSELYESVQTMALVPAVLSVIINPHRPVFKVTPKGNQVAKEFLNPMAGVFFIAIALNVCSVVAGVYKWFDSPLLRDTLIITGVWCAYNLFLLTISLGALWERKQIRFFHRINTREKAKVTFPRTGFQGVATVDDISLKGIGIRVNMPYPPAYMDRVHVELNNGTGRSYHFESTVQRITDSDGAYSCGLEFILDTEKYAESVSYVYGDSERWLRKWAVRSNSGNTLRILWHFLYMGVKGMLLISRVYWNWGTASLKQVAYNFMVWTNKFIPRKI